MIDCVYVRAASARDWRLDGHHLPQHERVVTVTRPNLPAERRMGRQMPRTTSGLAAFSDERPLRVDGTAEVDAASGVDNRKLKELLERIEIAIAVQQRVLLAYAERGDQTINRLADRVTAGS